MPGVHYISCLFLSQDGATGSFYWFIFQSRSVITVFPTITLWWRPLVANIYHETNNATVRPEQEKIKHNVHAIAPGAIGHNVLQ